MLKVEYGTLVALNEKIGLDRRDSTLSQILNSAKNSKTGKGKEMGSPMARKLEAACGKEIGWMDTDPELAGAAGPRYAPEVSALAHDINQLPIRQRDLVLMTIRNAVALAGTIINDEPGPGNNSENTNSHSETHKIRRAG